MKFAKFSSFQVLMISQVPGQILEDRIYIANIGTSHCDQIRAAHWSKQHKIQYLRFTKSTVSHHAIHEIYQKGGLF